MKKIVNHIVYGILYTLIIFLSSCEGITEDVSQITYYPILTLKGEQWNTIDVGQSFTDLGATATEGGNEINVKVGGDQVNSNIPGVYTITYTAVNKDGFSATEYRYVGVIDPSVKGKDMSGSYKRNAGVFGVSIVTKISDNFYKSDNVGGVAVGGPASTVFFYHYNKDLLGVPLQIVAGSPFYCENATVQLGASYKWIVRNSGYGPALRTFLKI
ncbi:MAG TPA: DUF5011 domain-containing protein [Saprospiraceae bacterium]|nr:DUF5011 domain-containing protein [Saprospiraceae bacterium]